MESRAGGPGVSIWDLSSASPYLFQSTVFDGVVSLLGPAFDVDPFQYDLDAMMVLDAGDDSEFSETGDSLIFSIRQLSNHRFH